MRGLNTRVLASADYACASIPARATITGGGAPAILSASITCGAPAISYGAQPSRREPHHRTAAIRLTIPATRNRREFACAGAARVSGLCLHTGRIFAFVRL